MILVLDERRGLITVPKDGAVNLTSESTSVMSVDDPGQVLQRQIDSFLVSQTEESTIYSERDAVHLVGAGTQGLRGPPGADGDGLLERDAGAALSALKAVRNSNDTAVYADCTVLDDAINYYGITTSAANLGDPVTIRRTGLISDNNWSWTPDAFIFLGKNGNLVETLPVDAVFSFPLGFAVTATTIFLWPREPVYLAG